MEVKVQLDEEEQFMAEYYAETLGVSIEEAMKKALFDKIRELYDSRSKTTGPTAPVESDMVDDDGYMDEDR